jgi:DNA polymerase-3 subunit delta
MPESSPAAGIPAVSILYGRKAREDLFDDFLAREHIASITARLAGDRPAEEAVTTTTAEYGAPECDLAEVLDEVCTPALWGGRRLVILRGAEKLLSPAAEGRAAVEPFIRRIASLVSAPDPPGRLVLVARALEIDKKLPKTPFKPAQALIGAVRRVGGLVSCIPPYENALKRTLARRAAQAGVTLDAAALDTLVGIVGPDQMALQEELDKLLVASAGERRITVGEVESLAAERPQATVFTLADSVLDRDAARSLAQLDALRRTPATRPASPMLSSLAGSFRRTLAAARLVRQGKSAREAAAALGVPPFFQDGFAARLVKWTPEALEALLSRTLQCDVEIKTGSLREQAALETFVCDACRGRLETGQLVGRWIYEV